MPSQKPPKERTVLWWILWITATIASFFAASAFWTPRIAEWAGSVRNTHAAMLWVVAVFGTWMIILLPLIVVMYYKIDKAYEDARLRREKAASEFKIIRVDPDSMILSSGLSRKISGWPETISGGHLVRTRLKDGREFPFVFVSQGQILGIYDQEEMPFRGEDVSDVEPVPMDPAPFFIQSKWLRLDAKT